MGLSRNGSGVSPERGSRWWARWESTGGKTSRTSRVPGAREEYVYAHTRVSSARSGCFWNRKSPFPLYSCAYIFSLPVSANESAFNEVLNFTIVDEGLKSMPMGPGELGSKVTDQDFRDGIMGTASPKSPSGTVTPSEVYEIS